jgi:hypothetical protein
MCKVELITPFDKIPQIRDEQFRVLSMTHVRSSAMGVGAVQLHVCHAAQIEHGGLRHTQPLSQRIAVLV